MADEIWMAVVEIVQVVLQCGNGLNSVVITDDTKAIYIITSALASSKTRAKKVHALQLSANHQIYAVNSGGQAREENRNHVGEDVGDRKAHPNRMD